MEDTTENDNEEYDEEGGEDDEMYRKGNTLTLWGNQQSMNLNNMILTNILSSPYFKNQLFELKTYHEVIDEIYYKVEHLEPWERGSRRTGGQTGMCGGVRGVGAGGIVSTPYCLLYKLYTLKLTRKQLKGLLDHPDSPYIRALGFMYIRYCLHPEDLWYWYAPYLDDQEEIDVKAGGGCKMLIGEMLEQWFTKLDWFSTLFPRIPVPVQKKLELQMRERREEKLAQAAEAQRWAPRTAVVEEVEEPMMERDRGGEQVRERHGGERDRHGGERERHSADRNRGDSRRGDGDRGHRRSDHRNRSRSRDRKHRRSRSNERHRRSRSRDRNRDRESSFERDLRKARVRQDRHKK